VVEEKWARPEAFSLAQFLDSLEKRIEAEQKLPTSDPIPLRIHPGTPQEQSEAFRTYWRARHGQTIPVSLLGIRELDRFLRTHYLASFLDDSRLVEAGFYLGEVARGLYPAPWVLEGFTDVNRVALRYPELDYYPIGRIWKMMTERPRGEPLDEYVRLIPSARKELRESEGRGS
jgi:hypothetical protein